MGDAGEEASGEDVIRQVVSALEDALKDAGLLDKDDQVDVTADDAEPMDAPPMDDEPMGDEMPADEDPKEDEPEVMEEEDLDEDMVSEVVRRVAERLLQKK